MQQSVTVKRVLVWSGPLRLSHWLMAVSVLLLLATGWLLEQLLPYHDALLDYHYLAGYALVAGLLMRAYLLFFARGSASIVGLIAQRARIQAMAAMLRFYLSLGRSPLPDWYAHNPLWQPVYLFLLVALIFQSLSGWFHETPYWIADTPIGAWHGLGARVIGIVCGLHVIAVFFHDLKGTGSDTSAMINGHRIFVIKPVPQHAEPGTLSVSPTQIERVKKNATPHLMHATRCVQRACPPVRSQ